MLKPVCVRQCGLSESPRAMTTGRSCASPRPWRGGVAAPATVSMASPAMVSASRAADGGCGCALLRDALRAVSEAAATASERKRLQWAALQLHFGAAAGNGLYRTAQGDFGDCIEEVQRAVLEVELATGQQLHVGSAAKQLAGRGPVGQRLAGRLRRASQVRNAGAHPVAGLADACRRVLEKGAGCGQCSPSSYELRSGL